MGRGGGEGGGQWGGSSDFSNKNGGIGKIGGIVFKKGAITYFYTN